MTEQFDQYPNEKRRSPRVSGDGFNVEYYSIGNELSPIQAPVKNICIHGICICMPSIDEGWKTIIMKILPAGRDTPIYAEGSVVWYNMFEDDSFYSVGIEFEKISNEDQEWISGHVKANLKKS